MPPMPYVVNMANCPFDFFREDMSYQEFWTNSVTGTGRASGQRA